MPPAAEAARDAHLAAGSEQHLCLDAGYDYEQVREVVAAHGYTAHIRPRGEEAQAKKPGKGLGAGWWSAPTPGSTGFGTCLSAGPNNRRIT